MNEKLVLTDEEFAGLKTDLAKYVKQVVLKRKEFDSLIATIESLKEEVLLEKQSASSYKFSNDLLRGRYCFEKYKEFEREVESLKEQANQDMGAFVSMPMRRDELEEENEKLKQLTCELEDDRRKLDIANYKLKSRL
jgi:hypothetical protein